MTKLRQSTIITNDKQFKQLAFQYYDNPSCISFNEFENDLRLFSTTTNAIGRIDINDHVNIRQIVNRVIIVHNLFGSFTAQGLYWKIDRDHHKTLTTILAYLNYLSSYDQQEIDSQLMAILQQL